MPPQTNITETNPHINHAVHAYKCTGRACPCPACPHLFALPLPALTLLPTSHLHSPCLPRPFPHSYLTPQKLCRIFRQICPKFSRMATTVHLFSSNGTSQHPYLTPKHLYRIFRLTCPQFPLQLPTKRYQQAEHIPGDWDESHRH
jgi:hypothetical protein